MRVRKWAGEGKEKYGWLARLNSDDGGKYSAREERTFSRTYKSRVLCLYREYRTGVLVRVNLSISSFSCLR